MNREQIIQMAKKAGIEDWWDSGNEHREVLQKHLEAFAKLVAEHEREACAKRLDAVGCDHCATNIRARGQA